mmetsp:Transcript_72544/g.125897  ORF Transcript_72544/g.125897 Transcript_72544/m.125897 type:complete len:214 (-) Transcript_72544:111-752(-)
MPEAARERPPVHCGLIRDSQQCCCVGREASCAVKLSAAALVRSCRIACAWKKLTQPVRILCQLCIFVDIVGNLLIFHCLGYLSTCGALFETRHQYLPTVCLLVNIKGSPTIWVNFEETNPAPTLNILTDCVDLLETHLFQILITILHASKIFADGAKQTSFCSKPIKWIKVLLPLWVHQKQWAWTSHSVQLSYFFYSLLHGLNHSNGVVCWIF